VELIFALAVNPIPVTAANEPKSFLKKDLRCVFMLKNLNGQMRN
jgi:hypothetical protein